MFEKFSRTYRQRPRPASLHPRELTLVCLTCTRGNTSEKEIARPGIVHRLDRETSGVIVIAKTQESFLNLKKQFQERKIEKKYNAFVYGALKEEKGIIDRPIGKSKSDFRQWSAQRGARGELREALTHYKVLEKNKDFTYVEVTPKTGRTHQIRVHLASIGHPLAGDKLYGFKNQQTPKGLNRHFLHASSLRIPMPDGSTKKFISELPKDLNDILKELS